MGVGKGTIARALVKHNNQTDCSQLCFSIDTDDLIESMENRSIKKIFQEDGEAYFRNLEQRCAKWCEKNLKNTIISTGGGFYRQKNIKDIGTIIYLESSFELIIQRLKDAPNSKAKFKKRPLLNDLVEAKELYKQRVEEYKNVSDIVINVEKWDMEKIIKQINKAIKK